MSGKDNGYKSIIKDAPIVFNVTGPDGKYYRIMNTESGITVTLENQSTFVPKTEEERRRVEAVRKRQTARSRSELTSLSLAIAGTIIGAVVFAVIIFFIIFGVIL